MSTTDYAMETTTTVAEAAELYADFIAAPASSMSPAAIAEHMQQNQITFEIPTAHDLRHIDAMHSFNSLLQRIGNAAIAYDTVMPKSSASSSSITTEQLSNSVVLDLADLREQHAAGNESTWQQIFGDADMHAIINYLWIGVVSSLLILSLIFIVFSCYFYRKFRTWKKCNKDIRAQIHATGDSYSSHGASHLLSCDSHLLQAATAAAGNEAAFYQIESPPCYTIATGLPSYDEALHHQPRHFAYGMKFMYPSLAAVHQHHQHQQQHQQQQQQQHHHRHHHHHHRGCNANANANAAGISNWEKEELQRQNKLQKCKLSATEGKASDICINMPTDMQHEGSTSNGSSSNNNVHATASATATATLTSSSPTQSLLPAAAADDDCASLVVVVLDA